MFQRLFRALALSAAILLPLVAAALAEPEKSPPPESSTRAEKPQQPSPAEIAEMMKKAEKLTQPGEHHKMLERFIGKWDTELRMFMHGQAGPPQKCTSETRWLMKGRWLQSEIHGSFMGRPFHGVMIIGYDNFKQSFVTMAISNLDTAMLHSEGDETQDRSKIICYGTLDEYLTGEHDKMVKYVWRFESDDKVVFEVHDLPIGETNTKVLEYTSTRIKE